MRSFLLYPFFFLLLFSGFLPAQEPEYTFRHLTTSNGLPSNSISTIIKDSDGFMWFGTSDGLTRYDGYT